MGQADVRLASLGEQGFATATADEIAATPGVAIAAPAFEQRTYLGLELIAPGDDLPAPVTIAGVVPDAEAALHDLTLASGAALDDADLDTALVSATLAREDDLRVGSTVSVQGPSAPATFRVVGVLAGDGPWADASGRAVVVPLAAAQSVFDTAGVTRIDLAVGDEATAPQLIDALQSSIVDAPYLLQTPRDVAVDLRASTGEFAATTGEIGRASCRERV